VDCWRSKRASLSLVPVVGAGWLLVLRVVDVVVDVDVFWSVYGCDRPDLTFPITSLPVYPSCWFGLAAAAA
jgi:hypothetical protein